MRQPAVIFDRDGTLFSVAHVAPATKDNDAWRNYNAALRFDAPVPIVAALFHSIRPGIAKIITSGRMEGDHPGDRHRRFAMQDSNYKHGIHPDRLLMREGGDTRPDSAVKQEILDRDILPYYNVVYAIDDRDQVVEMWRRNGIPVLQVKDPGVLPPIVGDRTSLTIIKFDNKWSDHHACVS